MEQLLKKLKSNNTNALDFYIQGKKQRKPFSELYADVMKAATLLHQKGIGKNDRVGVLGNNTYEWILIDLACISLGAVSVAFHNNKFENELTVVKEKYDLRWLFLDDIYKEENYPEDITTLFSELGESVEKLEHYEEFFCPLDQKDMFTIYFTSGTTSFPKAMGMSLASCGDFISNGSQLVEFEDSDKVILFLPFSAILERIYIYTAILVGFDIVMVATENVMKSLRMDKPTIMLGIPYLFENIHKVFEDTLRESVVTRIVVNSFFKLRPVLPKSLDLFLQKKLFKKVHQFWGGKMRLMLTGAAPIRKETLQFYQNIGLTLLEAYGLSETGLIGLNTPKHNKIGSVGKAFPNKDVVIDDQGQICVKGDYLFSSGFKYLDASEDDLVKFRDDGFFETGDTGYFDDEGFLFINGRIKEMIVLSNGKKTHPHTIEEKLNASPQIKQSMVFGENKPYLTALIVTDCTDHSEIEEEIKRINKQLPNALYIKDFHITNVEFKKENGQLTEIMKLNRRKILETYKLELEELY